VAGTIVTEAPDDEFVDDEFDDRDECDDMDDWDEESGRTTQRVESVSKW
jgi:hypothetical protein